MSAQNVAQADETVVSLKRTSGHRKKAAAVYRRVSIKNSQQRGSGVRLLQALNRMMAERNHGVDDVAAELGISSVYLRAIGNGARSFADVDRRVLQKAAAYLNVPVAQVYLMSDAMDASDFFYADTVDNQLHLAYNSMTTHPMWSGYAPSTEEWDAMTQSSKLFMCMLYESATSQRFLTPVAVQPPEVK